MIEFWHTTGQYGPFSNFYKCKITVDNHEWTSTEHYYQAQKTDDIIEQFRIRKAKSPKMAKQIASHCNLVQNWNEIKFDVMRKALEAKFTQIPELKQLLLDTGNEELVENSPYDYIWGCGKTKDGLNCLGHLLMELRAKLNNNTQEFEKHKNFINSIAK